MTTHSMSIHRKGNDLVMAGGDNETWTVNQGDILSIKVTLPQGAGCWLWVFTGENSGDAPGHGFPVMGPEKNGMTYIPLHDGDNTVRISLHIPRYPRKEFSLGLSAPDATGPVRGGGGESKNGTLVVTG